ncbi:MAG: NADH-dependent phenylglyoxylate [Spirochaetae bacterium HGW-Spirochaetae-7]|jgi:pyruvate ferredoxin oxidoreductase beta subunit/phenylglyoxylate dehydrogenase beta subunit|nr:MAG: NADH-dependent phenylglyoxylate [Spirochaetae bacterium HGW-Spirochaetae-7]
MNALDLLAEREDMISPGISACVGCNVELTLRIVMKVLGPNTVLAIPPGCMGGVGVVGWNKRSGAKVPVFFPLLDNTASMLAGIRLAYDAKGKDANIVAFAGDGATVDAGFQALSGVAERGDRIIYICYDNEGYMNTGYQRSSSTSKGSWTSTTPVSKDGHGGKRQNGKDFPMIMAMHDIPYVATASPAYVPDLIRKVEEAMKVRDGLAYIHVYNPCLTGWGIRAEESISVARLAVKTRYFPLYEARRREFRITVPVPKPLPIENFTSRIKKFSHLGPEAIADLGKLAEDRYAFLQSLCRGKDNNA